MLVRYDGFVLDILYVYMLDLDTHNLIHWLLSLLSRKDQILLHLGWWHAGSIGSAGLHDFLGLLLLLADFVNRVQDLLLFLLRRWISPNVSSYDVLGTIDTIVEIFTNIVVDVLG